jgi:hypothetical protein
MTEDFINSETNIRLGNPCGGAVTVPFPLPWMRDCPGPDRIQDHMAADLQKMSVLLDHNRFKPALKHVANSAVPLDSQSYPVTISCNLRWFESINQI